MKKILVIFMVLILVLSFGLVACQDNVTPPDQPTTKTKLSSPRGLKVNVNALISWEAVSGATSYELNINGTTYTVTSTSYQADKMLDFTVSVVAKGEGFYDSDPVTAKFESIWKQDKPVVDDKKDIVIGIEGSSHVNSDGSLQLKANVTGTTNTAVKWEVVEGGEYVTIDENGLLTATHVDSDKFVKVKCTSKENADAFAEKLLVLRARAILTQEMLDEIASKDKLSFVGYLNINLYTIALNPKLVQTLTFNVETAMDGENWFAQYESSLGIKQHLFYKNIGGFANQIGLSLMNDELYSPMLDDNDNKITWENSGFYNNFEGLTVSDFTFDEDEWRWVYTSKNTEFMKRVVASANPYDFDPIGLSLIIDNGEIVGFSALAGDDYSIAANYNAIQELFVAVAFGDTVDVPQITKYSTEEIHTDLKVALENMHALSSYKVTSREVIRTIYSSTYMMTGYYEYVTENLCHFEPFDFEYNSRYEEIIKPVANASYGFKKIRDHLYNSYFENSDGSFSASRAYETEFNDASPSFAFAPEIFRYYFKAEDGSTTYYVDGLMNSVATTFYKGLGNDVQLYGIYATADGDGLTPYVTVKDGYIVEAGFYFYLGSLWGIITLEYSDFNETSVPTEKNVSFKTRNVPTSWDELTVIVNDDNDNPGEHEINALEFFKSFFDNDDIADVLPFFGNVLGDTYAFSMTSFHIGYDKKAHRILNMYYDVPLDLDYTINTTMTAIKDYLTANGFVKNAGGEYELGDIVVFPTEVDLDFFIYVWKK